MTPKLSSKQLALLESLQRGVLNERWTASGDEHFYAMGVFYFPLNTIKSLLNRRLAEVHPTDIKGIDKLVITDNGRNALEAQS